MTSSASEPRVSMFRDEASEISSYRAVSKLSILALALGLASLLAVVSPVLWILPIIGVLVAVIALRSITAHPQLLTGRGIAILALTLSCFTVAFAPARHLTRQTRLYAQSRQWGEHWLELLRDGKVREAHQLRLPFNERAAVESALIDHYAQEQGKMMLESFSMQSPVSDILRWGQRCQVRYVGNVNVESKGSIDTVTQQFEVKLVDSNPPYTMKLELALSRRSFPGTNEARWEVQDVRVVSLPAGMPQ